MELFGSRTRPTFDELGAARTPAQMIVNAALRVMLDLAILQLRDDARRRAGTGAASEMMRAHWQSIVGDFAWWIDRRELPTPTLMLRPPPGDPFGEEPE